MKLIFFRLIAATFKIFAREVLGYQFTMVEEEQERKETDELTIGIGEFDTAVSTTTTTNNNEYPNNILAKLSSCESMM